MQDFGRGGGVQLIRSPRKRGPALVPMLKNLHRGPKGGPDPPPPDPQLYYGNM